MESAELNAFFNDCGLFPSQDEITEACESVGKVIHLFVFVSGIAPITGVTLSQSFGQSHLYRNFYSASGVILVIRQSKYPYSSTVMYRKYLNQLRIERNKCQLTLRPFLILSATEWAELRLRSVLGQPPFDSGLLFCSLLPRYQLVTSAFFKQTWHPIVNKFANQKTRSFLFHCNS